MTPRVRRCLGAVGLLSLAGCSSESEYLGAFELPVHGDVAVDGGPFDQPVIYVAGRTGGLIWPLAGKDGRFLTDDNAVSFLRGSALPVGRLRSIQGVAAWTPGNDRIDVFAVDGATGALLQVPHVRGTGPSGPEEVQPTVSEPVSTGGGSLTHVEAILGRATTETWIARFDGSFWWLQGDRTGALDDPTPPGERVTTSDGSLTVEFGGKPEAGETLTFRVDTGLVEHDLGAAAVGLATSPDQSRIAALTYDGASGEASLVWWDPAAASAVQSFVLEAGSRPSRPVFDAEGTLWFADGGLSGVWRGRVGEAPRRIPLPWPTLDVAPAPTLGRAFVVPVDGSGVWTLQIADDALVDVNPWGPGVNGVPVSSPVTGIAALEGEVLLTEDNDDGVARRTQVVAVSQLRGPVNFIDQRTGCMITDGGGPRSEFGGTSRLDYQAVGFDLNPGSSPWLEGNFSNTRTILANPCAGVTLAESWTVTFDSAVQAWRVEGARSGVQTNLAYEDRRYVSDNGEVNFLIRGGIQAPASGWQFRFSFQDGLMTANGDTDGDDIVDAASAEVGFRLPGDPIPLSWREVAAEGGWQTVIDRVYAVIPLEGADAVSRVRPEDGQVDAVWQ